MIIETEKESSGPAEGSRIKLIAISILALLIVASCLSGLVAKTNVFTALCIFAAVCGITLQVLLTTFGFWRKYFTPLLILLVWVPVFFGMTALRSDYEMRELARHGVTTYGRVIKVFNEPSRRWRNQRPVARIEFKTSNKMVYQKVGNPEHYLNENDTIRVAYASTDVDIFRVTGVKRFLPTFAGEKASQNYQAVLPHGIVTVAIDSPPQFKGGMAGFANYLRNALEYPLSAQEKRITGKVYLSFVIKEDGSVADVKVEKGLGYGCDEAAVKALQNSPAWIPGVQNGKAVRVKYNLPVSFSMR